MKGNQDLGRQKVTTAFIDMPGLRSLIDNYSGAQPLKGTGFLVCVTPTQETGAFLLTLQKMGGNIAACSDNAFATDNDVVAHLKAEGVTIFAESNMSQQKYFDSMDKAVSAVGASGPIQVIDDGCDITRRVATKHRQLLPRIKLISEQTTCGINYLRSLYGNGFLDDLPAININHSFVKENFDNAIGIQQSLVHALTVAGVSIPGKKVAIFGYGHLGKGSALALQRMGAQVGVVETDILKLMLAEAEGFIPLSANKALSWADLCLTATGCIDTITGEMLLQHAKDGLMLGNLGHGTQEYDVAYLRQNAQQIKINEHMDLFQLEGGRNIYSLCRGALVNFLAGGGNMPRIMDITFTLTLLAHLRHAGGLGLVSGLQTPSTDLQRECAERHAPHLSLMTTRLSNDQKDYIHYS